jgi:TetR/AcrR family transcriptional repressor of lmrAB and yxaGH operons
MPRADDSRTELVRTMARLLRDQGYTATGLAQVLAESGVSNGSLYHHFPGGKEELAEAALEASGQAVADKLAEALDGAPNVGAGVARFLDMVAEMLTDDPCAGCPVAPTALESPILGARVHAAAARCFHQWEAVLASNLRDRSWPEDAVPGAASVALTLIEGALLLARVTGEVGHLDHAKTVALSTLASPPRRPTRTQPDAG